MPDPQPVRPRRKDETAYYRALRRTLLDPMMVDIRAGVSEAASVSTALDEINGVDWDRYQRAGLVDAEIAEQSAKLQGYHKDRLIQTFRTSLGHQHPGSAGGRRDRFHDVRVAGGKRAAGAHHSAPTS